MSDTADTLTNPCGACSSACNANTRARSVSCQDARSRGPDSLSASMKLRRHVRDAVCGRRDSVGALTAPSLTVPEQMAALTTVAALPAGSSHPVKPDNVTAEQLVRLWLTYARGRCSWHNKRRPLPRCLADVQSCDNLGGRPATSRHCRQQCQPQIAGPPGAHLEVEDHAGASPPQYAAQFDGPHLVE